MDERIEKSGDDLNDYVSRLWRELLNVPEIADADDFFDLGGNSMLAIRMLVAVSGYAGQDFDMEAFFRTPTLATLRRLIALSPAND
jgi:phthiocerol/phenolphthiocerol synthesis type-I polyketide synthase E